MSASSTTPARFEKDRSENDGAKYEELGEQEAAERRELTEDVQERLPERDEGD